MEKQSKLINKLKKAIKKGLTQDVNLYYCQYRASVALEGGEHNKSLLNKINSDYAAYFAKQFEKTGEFGLW